MPPAPWQATLAGQRIAITRPAAQAASLLERIQALGGEATPLPLLEITPPAAPISSDALKRQCQAADLIIFISPTAVRMALQPLPRADWRPACIWPRWVKVRHEP